MFVRNACTTDVRVLREADTLCRAGWDTTIVALQTGGAKPPPDEEMRDGVRIIRIRAPADWRKRWHALRAYPWRALRRVPRSVISSLRRGRPGFDDALRVTGLAVVTMPYSAVQATRYFVGGYRPVQKPPDHSDPWDHLAWWRLSALGWADAAAAAAPAADVYHGHDLTGLPAAVAAARRHSDAVVVYDSHELFLEAGIEASQPWWVRRVLGRFERGLVRQAVALITVNTTLAEQLRRRYGGPPAVIVRNAPPRQPAPAVRPDHLRSATGVHGGAPVVLYHGGFQRDRGLEILAEAMLDPRLDGAHLMLLGFGPLAPTLQALASEERFGGRVHVLPAVSPDDLLDWVASADVSAMPNQPRTENERLSTPNKLFESIAVGTPVVSSDFPERRAIVIDDPDGPLGAVCDPTKPELLAAALAEVISLDPIAMADLRARCLRAAHERYNWETESTRLLGVYDAIHEGRAAR